MLSDYEIMAILGGCAALIAALATWAERRRMRRRNLDSVGFMPWTHVFFFSALIACVALGLAAREWLAS